MSHSINAVMDQHVQPARSDVARTNEYNLLLRFFNRVKQICAVVLAVALGVTLGLAMVAPLFALACAVICSTYFAVSFVLKFGLIYLGISSPLITLLAKIVITCVISRKVVFYLCKMSSFLQRRFENNNITIF